MKVIKRLGKASLILALSCLMATPTAWSNGDSSSNSALDQLLLVETDARRYSAKQRRNQSELKRIEAAARAAWARAAGVRKAANGNKAKK
jgi:hypothetical protein